MADHNNIGQWGENTAANLLVQKGFSIRERNLKIGHLEIDIIAENKSLVAFVEVKTRSSLFGGKSPEEYVDHQKQRNICRAANIYIKQQHIEKTIRFDIISIIKDSQTETISEIKHIENAFFPPMKTINSHSYKPESRWHSKSYWKRRTL